MTQYPQADSLIQTLHLSLFRKDHFDTLMATIRKKGGMFVLLVLGVIFGGIGGAMLYFLGHNIQLDAVRGQPECSIVMVDVLGKSEVVETFPLENLQGAHLEESETSKGGRTYRIAIDTTDGSIPLAEYFSSGRRSYLKKVKAINDFVSQNQPELHVVQSGILIRLFGLVFLGVGLFLLLGFLFKILRFLLALVVLVMTRSGG